MVSARRESENRMKYRLGGELVRFSLDQLSDEALWGALDELRERAKDDAAVERWRKRGAPFRPAPRAERRAVIVKFSQKPAVEALAQLRRFGLHYASVRREWSGRVAIDGLAVLRDLVNNLRGTMEEVAVEQQPRKQLIQVSLPIALTPDEARELHRLGLRWSPSLCLYEGVASLERAARAIEKWNGRAAMAKPGEVMPNRYPPELSIQDVIGLRCEIVWPKPPSEDMIERLPQIGAELIGPMTAKITVNGNIKALERVIKLEYGGAELRAAQSKNPSAQ